MPGGERATRARPAAPSVLVLYRLAVALPVLGLAARRGHDLAGWVLDSGLPVRMQLQLHKVIWPDIPRGV